MIKVILNGKKMLTRQTLHAELKEKLDLPDYYGANLDALWDCLTGWIDTPSHIVWEDASVTKEVIPEYFKRTLSVFREAEKEGFVVLTITN
ncbi:barstar family protein [Desulfovibrio sp. Huiquan2017]|uniref:barstar family protein n=1 Tax=Desulfovibrio sp. Huiquan2017 TaxID=2816861 RepID=UPI001A930C88|nr:barstar family protein [Desulfovibrio sp. Huiquan2017]